MRGLKAVVLEKNGSFLTVLSSDGTFQKIRHKGKVEIGAEIEIPNAKSVPVWRIGASVAAIFLMAFMGIFGWSIFKPGIAVAMLSVDINPSLQLTVDRKGRVLELQSLNPDGEQLLAGLPLKGEQWQEALSDIIEQSVNLNYLNPQHTWVIVGYSPIKAEQDLPAMEMDTEEITERIEKAAAGKGVTPKVAVYALTTEEQVQSKETGLTLGEYALVNTAKKAGVNVNPQEVKNKQERVRLLEKPEIQEQLKKEKRIKEIKKVIPDGADSHTEESQGLGIKKNPANQEDIRNEIKLNEKKWLYKPNQIIPSRKSLGVLDRDKANEEKHQGTDGKKDSDRGQSDEGKKKSSGK